MSTATVTPEPIARGAARRRVWTSPRVLPVLATFVLFVLMFGAGSVRYDGFFSAQVLLNLLVDNAYLIVLAVGMTFVILTGGIDLSVGSVVALSGVLAAKLLSKGWCPVPVMLLVLLVGLALGLAMGVVIHYLELQPFVVTLCWDASVFDADASTCCAASLVDRAADLPASPLMIGPAR